MPTYTLAVAGSDDADAIAELWVELADGQGRHGTHLLAAANRAHVRESLLQGIVADSVFLARRDGDPVGFVSFGRESERYRQDCTRGIVHNIYVREAARDQGVGSLLLAAAERTLRARGADVVGLEAMAANEAARRFYRRRGYEPHRVELEKTLESDSLTKPD